MTDEVYDKRTGEVWNSVRAGWAKNALDAFAQDTYDGRSFDKMLADSAEEGESDAYCAAQDLMTNIMHLANQHGWNVDDIVRRAQRNFIDELNIEAMA